MHHILEENITLFYTDILLWTLNEIKNIYNVEQNMAIHENINHRIITYLLKR